MKISYWLWKKLKRLAAVKKCDNKLSAYILDVYAAKTYFEFLVIVSEVCTRIAEAERFKDLGELDKEIIYNAYYDNDCLSLKNDAYF